MNPLNSIKMHTKGLERAWAEIKTDATREKAREGIGEACSRMGLGFFAMVGVPAPSVSIAIPEAVVGVSLGGEAQTATVGETVVATFKQPEIYKGNPVLTPITDWEVGEPGPGVMPEGDTHESVAEIPPVGMIGGWPENAEITISGLAPNRRHLRGILPDSRVVTVERTFRKEWKGGERVNCRLIRAGAACLYRVA